MGGAHSRLDYYGAFSRFDSSNALPLVSISLLHQRAPTSATTSRRTPTLRFTIRNAVSATGVPNAHDFYGISADGKQSDQDLYSGATVENRYHRWHNLVRYGIARKREQLVLFQPSGELLMVPSSFGPYPDYFGNTVTIRGANGYTATGRPPSSPAPPFRMETISRRFATSSTSSPTTPSRRISSVSSAFVTRMSAASSNNPTFFSFETTKRTNFQYTLQFQGDFFNRVFYSLGGAVERNNLYGTAGTPRFGLAWVPVRPGNQFFHGTKHPCQRRHRRAGALALRRSSTLFTSNSPTPARPDLITAYNVRPSRPCAPAPSTLVSIRTSSTRSSFSRPATSTTSSATSLTSSIPEHCSNVFGIDITKTNLFGALLNTLAFRAQGFEGELQFAPTTHILMRGGYTYLASLVEQSFSTDAAANGTSAENPNLPGVPIGSSYPLVGQRPFRRPPQTGFFAAQYTTTKFSAALKGAFASRSDDSTFLSFADDPTAATRCSCPTATSTSAMPSSTLMEPTPATRHVSVFAELGNLLSQQHIGPIGYPALPFTFRTGLKVRVGGD